MPRLNPREQVTTGYGACWYNESRQVANDHGAEIRLSDNTLLASRACNFVYANGLGQWAAFLAGVGVFGPGLDLPTAGMPLGNGSDPLGPDGSMIVKRNVNSFGPYGFVGGADIPGDFDQIQNCGGGQWVGQQGGVIRSSGIVAAGILGEWPRWKDGHFLYQAPDGTLVLDGKAVATAGDHFRPDFVVRADGSVLVVASQDAGETIPQRYAYSREAFAALPVYAPSRVVPVPQIPVTPLPTPIPAPAPTPTPPVVPVPSPKGSSVIHVDAQPVGFSGHKVANGDGSFAVKKANGKYASKQPDGSWQDRDAVGPWETFVPTNSANIAVIYLGDAQTALVAYVETPDA